MEDGAAGSGTLTAAEEVAVALFRRCIDDYAASVMAVLSTSRAGWVARRRSRQVRDHDDPDHSKALNRIHDALRELRRLDGHSPAPAQYRHRVQETLDRPPDQLTAATAGEVLQAIELLVIERGDSTTIYAAIKDEMQWTATLSEPFLFATIEKVARLGAPPKEAQKATT